MTHTTEVTDDAESPAQRDGHGHPTLAYVHAAPDARFDREERQTVFVSDTVTFGPWNARTTRGTARLARRMTPPLTVLPISC